MAFANATKGPASDVATDHQQRASGCRFIMLQAQGLGLVLLGSSSESSVPDKICDVSHMCRAGRR